MHAPPGHWAQGGVSTPPVSIPRALVPPGSKYETATDSVRKDCCDAPVRAAPEPSAPCPDPVCMPRMPTRSAARPRNGITAVTQDRVTARNRIVCSIPTFEGRSARFRAVPTKTDHTPRVSSPSCPLPYRFPAVCMIGSVRTPRGGESPVRDTDGRQQTGRNVRFMNGTGSWKASVWTAQPSRGQPLNGP